MTTALTSKQHEDAANQASADATACIANAHATTGIARTSWLDMAATYAKLAYQHSQLADAAFEAELNRR